MSDGAGPAVSGATGGARGRVVVVGAGLAGLACALRLHAAGVEVDVREAGPRVGGRVATDVVDGFSCDVGFQLVNPSYPALVAVLDEIGGVGSLALRPFGAGVVVATAGGRHVLADPRRMPSALWSSITAPPGSLREKTAFAAWAALAGYSDPARVARPRRGDTTLAASLDAAGVHGRLRSAVVEPFLAGVLGEGDGWTSAAFARLDVRSLVRGTPAVPAAGVGALPELLADALPAGAVVLDAPVRSLDEARRGRADGPDAVVVATDASTAATLVPSLGAPRWNALTTFWHATDHAPSAARLLHVDGDRRGPVVNTAVMTNVAPSYAPAGRHLVASTVLGDRGDAPTERAVREHVALVYGTSTSGWDLVAVHALPRALPAMPPPLQPRRPVDLGDGVFVTGDHRDLASQQGALTSGRRTADAVLARLGVSPDPAGRPADGGRERILRAR